MRTAMMAAGVCALGSHAQQGTATADGLLERFEVGLNGTLNSFVDAGGLPISQESDFDNRSTVFVPQAWEDRSFDRLTAGQNEARSEFEAVIESENTLLQGRLDIRADAISDVDASGSSARLFHELNVSAEDLDVFGDVLITLDASGAVGGFGQTTLTYIFRSDEFTRRGSVRNDETERLSLLFEDVNITHLDIAFIARTNAGTDSPVTNSSAFLNVHWSVEIIPIPAPGSAAALAGFGLVTARRRR